MTRLSLLACSALAAVIVAASPCTAQFSVLSPTDSVLAIDIDSSTGSNFPGGEAPPNVLDGDSNTKYLNFGETNTGFIVTPSSSSILQSFTLTTANDFAARDPASYVLFGTNDPITSVENGRGLAENWTEISSGNLSLSDDRFALSAPVGFSNSTSYSSYRMLFPTVKDAANANSMQIADVGFYPDTNGTGGNLLSGSNPIIAIRDVPLQSVSGYPGAEGPVLALDGNPNTKYLNTAGQNSGLIVTPARGSTFVTSIRFTTANDAPERDPASFELYGTNDAIVSTDNSLGNGENWTLISSGALNLPENRLASSGSIPLSNTNAYQSYRVIFPTIRDPAATGLMQIADIALEAQQFAGLTINRQTGQATIVADSPTSFRSYRITSNSGLNPSGWASIASTNGDPGDAWAESEATASVLAEADTNGGDDDGVVLSGGQSRSLGVVRRVLPTAFEDVLFSISDADGNTIGGAVQYVGTEVPFGDYSGNGSVGPEDWPLFRQGYGGDYTGLTAAEAYLGGDLDGDFDSDLADFNLFVAAAGGAAALFGVPEPTGAVLLVGALLAGMASVRRRVAAAALLGVVLLAPTQQAAAQLFTNVGGTPISVTKPVNQLNETVDSGPMNLFDDGVLDGPGAIAFELFSIDYNNPNLPGGPFDQYAGLGAAPKTVFFDYGSTVNANWFAYSQRSGADPTADRVGTFEFWFSNSDFGGVVPTTEPDSKLTILPTDNRLRDSMLRPYPLFGEQSGRYVAMRLTVSELSSDQPVNNIGGHEFRLLSGPSEPVLTVNRGTGRMTLSNSLAGATSLPIKSIAIESPSGGLDAAGFNGLGGDSAAFPAGNGNGAGWEVGGGSFAERLVEANYTSESTLAAGVSGLDLGTGYNELSLANDLVFTWTNSAGEVYNGRVEYVGAPVEILIGDYNNDGAVNAADYTVWRDANGTAATLPNDVTPGAVDQSDYDRWVANYGAPGSPAAATPEPTAAGLASLGWLMLAAHRRK